jgi:hypothetical protein
VEAPGVEPGTYVLVEFGVEIKAEKANGKEWDRSSGPDPSLTLQLNGETISECEHRDLTVVQCEVDKVIAIDAKSVFSIAAIDSDLAVDDHIGRARLEGLSTFGTTEKPIAMEVEGQLAKAYLRIKAPPAPPVEPTWLGLYTSRLIGLAIGIALGLLLLFGFKDFWFRERKPRDKAKKEEEAV